MSNLPLYCPNHERTMLRTVQLSEKFFRQDLSGISIYINRAAKELQEQNENSATLLYLLSQNHIDMRSLEAWAITKTAPSMHLCQCSSCQKSGLDNETKRLLELAQPMQQTSGTTGKLRETDLYSYFVPLPRLMPTTEHALR